MNIFNRIKLKRFKVGQILKFQPGYHTKNPYYVEIIGKGKNFIKTSIPNEHELEIWFPIKGKNKKFSNWDYHIKRISIIGMKDEFDHLLFNQRLD